MAEITLTEQNFNAEVLQSDKPVLVDFWATWCGPCRMVAPTIAAIAQETEGKYKVGKVNVDEQSRLAAQYQIASIPTLVVFKNGRAVNTAVGVRSKEDILSLLD